VKDIFCKQETGNIVQGALGFALGLSLGCLTFVSMEGINMYIKSFSNNRTRANSTVTTVSSMVFLMTFVKDACKNGIQFFINTIIDISKEHIEEKIKVNIAIITCVCEVVCCDAVCY
jgi:hypothetical protein